MDYASIIEYARAIVDRIMTADALGEDIPLNDVIEDAVHLAALLPEEE
jgi:hypothetical protein